LGQRSALGFILGTFYVSIIYNARDARDANISIFYSASLASVAKKRVFQSRVHLLHSVSLLPFASKNIEALSDKNNQVIL
jgi:hypothetical protein